MSKIKIEEPYSKCVIFIWEGERNNTTIIIICGKGVGMIRVDFGPISETVYIDIILNTIIER